MTTAPLDQRIPLKIEFGGGMEMLFSNQRTHRVNIPAQIPLDPSSTNTANANELSSKPTDMTYLISWLRDNLLTERADLFVEGSTVCVYTMLCNAI